MEDYEHRMPPRHAVPFREAEIDLDQLAANLARLVEPASAGVLVDVGADAWGHGIEVIVPALRRSPLVQGFVVARQAEAERVRAVAGDALIVVTQLSQIDDLAWMRELRAVPALRTRTEFERAVAARVTTIMLVPDDGAGRPALDAATHRECSAQAQGRSIAMLDADIVVLGSELFGLADEVHPSAEGPGGELHSVLRLWAPVSATKRVGADEGVSYGYTYRTRSTTTLALVTLGYSDGISRSGGNLVPVSMDGTTRAIAGRVAMDAFMLDVGDVPAPRLGTEVTVLGDARRGEPTAAALGSLLDMSSAEITTRLTARPHRYGVHRNAPGRDHGTGPKHSEGGVA